MWVLLVNAGVPQGLEEIARRLALLDDNASLVGNIEVLFSSVLFFATVYLLTQTAITTLGAFFYNLISDLVGGIEIIVLEEFKNELSRALSPYLLQHAHQQVAWQIWDKKYFREGSNGEKLLLGHEQLF